MSRFLTWTLANLLQPYGRLDFVRLWETPTGFAECDYFDIFTDEDIEQYKAVKFIDGDEEITVEDLLNAE